MRNFAHKRWTPDGPRPHVLARTDVRAERVTNWLFAQPGYHRLVPGDHPTLPWRREWCKPTEEPLAAWHPQWRQIVAPIAKLSRHLTLGWVDLPVADAPEETMPRLGEAMKEALNEFPVVRLDYTRVIASTHGIQLLVERTPELDQLAHATAVAMRSVFDDEVVRTPDLDTWVPHVALAYGVADVDTPSLQIDLQPSSYDPLERVVCCEHDTWAEGWPQYRSASSTDIRVDIDAARARERRLFYAFTDDDAFPGIEPRLSGGPIPYPLPPVSIRIG